MPEVLMRRAGINFQPVSEYDIDALRYIKTGEDVSVKITKPRNYRYHKKFFVFLQYVFDNQDKFLDFEKMRKYIIIKSGFYTVVHRTETQIMLMADSISFAKMDDTKFRDLFSKAVNVVIHDLITGTTPEEIEQTVERLIVSFG